MSQSINSNDSGFRSRQRQRIKRQQARKKLIFQYKNTTNQFLNENNTNNNQNEQRKYLRLQQLGQLYKNKQYQDEQNQSDDDMDMFADQDQVKKNDQKKQKKQRKTNNNNQNTDDQGYYISIQNKLINNGKYKIMQKLGKGMFGCVIKACKLQNESQIFAIKIIRNNDMMIQSGQKQYQILFNMKKTQYIMKLSDYFFQSGHLCLVCELMGQDLRSYVRKHQSEINLEQIRKYAINMFMSMHQLRKHKIIHADIKPDNFLFTQDYSKVKLCDFGTSYKIDQHSNQIQYLVARYYRAPQIILGCQISGENRHHIDTWAVGCSLFQLYTGQFLFNGNTNNQMLKQMMETKGKFNVKMLKNSIFMNKHFDEEFNFLFSTVDKITKKSVIKKMQISITAEKQLFQRMKKHMKQGQDIKKLYNFRDFLEKCLTLNPKDRLTPQEAFLHPFLNYQIKLS